jgi:hypothetical protein
VEKKCLLETMVHAKGTAAYCSSFGVAGLQTEDGRFLFSSRFETMLQQTSAVKSMDARSPFIRSVMPTADGTSS